jgi:hypothetical protein
MCYFLTVAVPAKDTEAVQSVFQPAFQARAIRRAECGTAVPPTFATFVVTNGPCSCDLFTDSAGQKRPDSSEKLRRKYESRGWNDARIERAMTQAKLAQGRAPARYTGLRPDFIERLQHLVELTGEVRAFVHWYSSDLESETLPLVRLPTCGLAEIRQRAAELCENQVLVVKKLRGICSSRK